MPPSNIDWKKDDFDYYKNTRETQKASTKHQKPNKEQTEKLFNFVQTNNLIKESFDEAAPRKAWKETLLTLQASI